MGGRMGEKYGMRLRLSSLLLIFSLFFTFPFENARALDFTDVKSFFEEIAWAVARGITKGTSATEFSPDKTCTYQQIIVMIYRSAGSPEPKTAWPFDEKSAIKPDTEAGKAFHWAYESGMLDEWLEFCVGLVVRNGKILITDKMAVSQKSGGCTRKCAVTFLWHLAGAPEPTNSNLPFTDVSPDDPSYKAIAWAVETKITNGTSETLFSSDSICTRLHIALFLYRYYHAS